MIPPPVGNCPKCGMRLAFIDSMPRYRDRRTVKESGPTTGDVIYLEWLGFACSRCGFEAEVDVESSSNKPVLPGTGAPERPDTGRVR